jgi:hypothetical protein
MTRIDRPLIETNGATETMIMTASASQTPIALDGILVEFPSMVNAVACLAEIQLGKSRKRKAWLYVRLLAPRL